MNDELVTAYIAVGSNLGDRKATIENALRLLQSNADIQITRRSSLLDNPAVGGPAGSPDFLNGVIEIQTTLTAPMLLRRLLETESTLGRERRQRWSPRTIDLDLLLYGDAIIETDQLTIPHPRLPERRFVLQPLSELTPDLRVPGTGQTVADLLAKRPA